MKSKVSHYRFIARALLTASAVGLFTSLSVYSVTNPQIEMTQILLEWWWVILLICVDVILILFVLQNDTFSSMKQVEKLQDNKPKMSIWFAYTVEWNNEDQVFVSSKNYPALNKLCKACTDKSLVEWFADKGYHCEAHNIQGEAATRFFKLD